MNQLAIDLTAARAGRDQGMAKSLGHAESVEPGWGDIAYSIMERYLSKCHGAKITSYHFIRWYEGTVYPQPPTPKAFGPIFTKAARNGLIRKVGYQPHPLRHNSPTVTWCVV